MSFLEQSRGPTDSHYRVARRATRPTTGITKPVPTDLGAPFTGAVVEEVVGSVVFFVVLVPRVVLVAVPVVAAVAAGPSQCQWSP